MAQAGPARTQFRPTKKQLQAKDSKRVRKAWSNPYVYRYNVVRDKRFRYRGNPKGLFSCAEQSRVVRSESLKSVNLVPTQRAGMRGVIQAGGRSLWWSQMVGGDPLQNTLRALCCPSNGAMPTLGYVFLRRGLAMEEL